MESQQTSRSKIIYNGKILKNVNLFKYLVSLFTSDGKQSHDIKVRIVIAMKRCGQMKDLFNSPLLSAKLKIRLYAVAICSLLTYGCESWALTDKVLRQLNGANSCMLSHITGKSIQAEARRSTTSYDLIRHVRVMRLKWLGQILRSKQTRLVWCAAVIQSSYFPVGSLLMDAPRYRNIQELVTMAKDKAFWSDHIRFIWSDILFIFETR